MQMYAKLIQNWVTPYFLIAGQHEMKPHVKYRSNSWPNVVLEYRLKPIKNNKCNRTSSVGWNIWFCRYTCISVVIWNGRMMFLLWELSTLRDVEQSDSCTAWSWQRWWGLLGAWKNVVWMNGTQWKYGADHELVGGLRFLNGNVYKRPWRMWVMCWMDAFLVMTLTKGFVTGVEEEWAMVIQK